MTARSRRARMATGLGLAIGVALAAALPAVTNAGAGTAGGERRVIGEARSNGFRATGDRAEGRPAEGRAAHRGPGANPEAQLERSIRNRGRPRRPRAPEALLRGARGRQGGAGGRPSLNPPPLGAHRRTGGHGLGRPHPRRAAPGRRIAAPGHRRRALARRAVRSARDRGRDWSGVTFKSAPVAMHEGGGNDARGGTTASTASRATGRHRVRLRQRRRVRRRHLPARFQRPDYCWTSETHNDGNDTVTGDDGFDAALR
jgi:hypothetical protein